MRATLSEYFLTEEVRADLRQLIQNVEQEHNPSEASFFGPTYTRLSVPKTLPYDGKSYEIGLLNNGMTVCLIR